MSYSPEAQKAFVEDSWEKITCYDANHVINLKDGVLSLFLSVKARDKRQISMVDIPLAGFVETGITLPVDPNSSNIAGNRIRYNPHSIIKVGSMGLLAVVSGYSEKNNNDTYGNNVHRVKPIQKEVIKLNHDGSHEVLIRDKLELKTSTVDRVSVSTPGVSQATEHPALPTPVTVLFGPKGITTLYDNTDTGIGIVVTQGAVNFDQISQR